MFTFISQLDTIFFLADVFVDKMYFKNIYYKLKTIIIYLSYIVQGYSKGVELCNCWTVKILEQVEYVELLDYWTVGLLV